MTSMTLDPPLTNLLPPDAELVARAVRRGAVGGVRLAGVRLAGVRLARLLVAELTLRRLTVLLVLIRLLLRGESVRPRKNGVGATHVSFFLLVDVRP